MFCLQACLHLHVRAWCQCRTEEAVSSPETRVTDVVSCHVAAWNGSREEQPSLCPPGYSFFSLKLTSLRLRTLHLGN